jgi:MoxR-like ATPase
LIQKIDATLSAEMLGKIQTLVSKIKCAESLIDYIYRLVEFTRTSSGQHHGLSPRAAMSLLQAAKSWALIEGRSHVIPDDIQAVFPSVAEHRISGGHSRTDNPLSQIILKSVDIF